MKALKMFKLLTPPAAALTLFFICCNDRDSTPYSMFDADQAPELQSVIGPVLSAAGSGACTEGMVSFWKFDEGSGTTAYDSYDGNDGALINGPFWTTGQVGGALSFDGEDDYVSIPSSASLDITQAITVEMWINSPNYYKRYAIFLIKGSVYRPLAYGLRMFDTTGRPLFQIVTLDNNIVKYNYIVSPEPLTNNQWYHLVGTYDGSHMKIYVNGLLKKEESWSGSIVSYDYYPLEIGGYSASGSKFRYPGLIDEVAIYSRPLTAEEIQEHYQNGLQGKAYCKFYMIEVLLTVVGGLDLPEGTENSLVSKVENVIKSLEKGNSRAAVNQLQAFINHVEAQSGKKIAEQDADMLVEYANHVIAEIQTGNL